MLGPKPLDAARKAVAGARRTLRRRPCPHTPPPPLLGPEGASGREEPRGSAALSVAPEGGLPQCRCRPEAVRRRQRRHVGCRRPGSATCRPRCPARPRAAPAPRPPPACRPPSLAPHEPARGCHWRVAASWVNRKARYPAVRSAARASCCVAGGCASPVSSGAPLVAAAMKRGRPSATQPGAGLPALPTDMRATGFMPRAAGWLAQGRSLGGRRRPRPIPPQPGLLAVVSPCSSRRAA